MADQEELLGKLRKQFEQDSSDEKPLRDEAEIDLRFEAGDQWDDDLKAFRIANKRPVLTFARCHTFVQQVANEARQNKPQIKYIPAEEGDKDTAEIYEGLARHIQYASEAQEAYETAVDYSAAGGFGYFRYLTDYCDDESFDLDLKVVSVPDPFAVYGILIPTCFGLEPDHAFVVEEMPKDAFLEEWSESKLSDFPVDRETNGWIGTETVRVAEYWYVEKTSKEVTNAAGKKRKVTTKKVKFFKTNGHEILPGSETEWAGDCIPIFPVLAKKKIVRGKPILSSVIRFQRDPQQMLNMYKTRIAETLTTAPVQPYMVVEGQVEGHQAEWARLNSAVVPYLQYKAVDINGKPAPPPQRQVFEAPIQSLSEAAAQEIDDMKATAGIFDPSLGNKSNSVSGIAKQRDQQQSSLTNLHFLDNLERAFQKAGRAMSKLIPIIYDAPRMVRILGSDEEPKIVKINQDFQEGQKVKNYKVGGDGVGKYDVVVTMGRSFSTKRMESFDLYTQMAQANPEMALVTSDIMLRNSDTAGADEAAERMKRYISSKFPGIIEDKNADSTVIPPQVKATLDQLTQQHQMLTQANQALTEEVQTQAKLKQMELDSQERMKAAELQSREKIEFARLETQRDLAEIGATVQDSLQRQKLDADLNAKLAVQEHGQVHDTAMRAAEIGHETAMADKGHQQAQEIQANQPEPSQGE
jgi:hypothetical protein